MTQPPIPPPSTASSGPTPTALVGVTGPTPWSALAITAFVCALLGFLGVTAILGIILAIAGIQVTSGGKKRGMGLAIAALPISLVTGLISVALIFAIVLTLELTSTVQGIASVFEAAVPARAEAMADFRGFTSKSFDESVSQEQFFAWVDRLQEEHGKLTQVYSDIGGGRSAPQTRRDDRGRIVLSVPAKFVNGPATMQVVFTRGGSWRPKLDDISVGGVSVRDTP